MIIQKNIRLGSEVFRLKKAWLLAAAMRGESVNEGHVSNPQYIHWENKRLKRETNLLQKDLQIIAPKILESGKASEEFVNWCAAQYEKWARSNQSIFTLGRVHEVEAAIGLLKCRRFMECPPYAQIVLQGFKGAAIRHPDASRSNRRSGR